MFEVDASELHFRGENFSFPVLSFFNGSMFHPFDPLIFEPSDHLTSITGKALILGCCQRFPIRWKFFHTARLSSTWFSQQKITCEGAPKNGSITKCKQIYPRFHYFRSLNQVLYLHRLYLSPISVVARWEHVSAKHRLRKLPPEHGGEQQLGR